jgi:hypothetical protein
LENHYEQEGHDGLSTDGFVHPTFSGHAETALRRRRRREVRGAMVSGC